MYHIYLSGPIAGLTFQEATEWRQQVADELEDNYDVEVLDPMRDVYAETETVIGNPTIDNEFAETHSVTSIDASMLSDRGIVTRDHNDTVRSDILIVNLLGAKEKSIGTVAEIAWAWDRQIPTVVMMEPTGNLHEHPFIRGMTSYRVDSLERALNVVKSVMGLRPFWSVG